LSIGEGMAQADPVAWNGTWVRGGPKRTEYCNLWGLFRDWIPFFWQEAVFCIPANNYTELLTGYVRKILAMICTLRSADPPQTIQDTKCKREYVH